ncbi:SpoIIE family protein phosphatase [Streptacidiphilus monticola]
MELAHVYLPAGAGGGWFDVIPLSGARVALVAGDTLGDTAGAHVGTGELRAVIEALSDLDLPPDEVLERVHDLTADSDLAGAATCLYVEYDPVTRICAAAGAGHPPPLLVHRDGTVETLDVVTGPPLGKGLAQYRSTARVLPEGAVLALRNEALRPDGVAGDDQEVLQERVRGALAAGPEGLQRACEAVAEALTPRQPAHDAYLLLARTQVLGPDRTRTWTLPHEPEVVGRARRLATRQAEEWGVGADVVDNTALIVSELVTNAVRYAQGPIQVRLIHADSSLTCEVTDGSNTAPHLRRALDTDESGRGLFITAQLSQRWGVRHAGRGKTIWAEQTLAE